ncbi:hypothetical protein CSB20_12765 [bacterium DOLZORAL124_64_63]|nr:MAG: hypothetical protein CSB20_12765 [bacterium DOLZORAL124_64_63]
MKSQLSKILLIAMLTLGVASYAAAQATIQETVPGGELELEWVSGFGVPLLLTGETLESGDVGYDNPSGDHTVLVLENNPPMMGGLGMAMTNPGDTSDYVWEGWVNTGDASTRRGLLFRGNPEIQFTTSYQFVLEPGLLQLKFRKMTGHRSQDIVAWYTSDTPSGMPGENEWHHLKVEARGSNFRFWYDDYELTQGTPVEDTDLLSGWVGILNFRYNLGGVQVLFDDLMMTDLGVVATTNESWGSVKSLYR